MPIWWGSSADKEKAAKAQEDVQKVPVEDELCEEIQSDEEMVCVQVVDPNRDYKLQIATLKNANDQLNRQMVDAEALHKKEISHKERVISDRESKVREHELKLHQSKQELERVKSALKGKEEETKLLEDRILHLRKDGEITEGKRKESDETITALRNELVKNEQWVGIASRQRESVMEELKAAKDEIEKLRNTSQVMERQICNLEITLQSSLEEISQLKALVERYKFEMHSQKTTLQQELENAKTMSTQGVSQAHDLLSIEKQKLAANAIQIDNLQRECGELKNHTALVEAEKNAVKKRMDSEHAIAAAKQRELEEEAKQLRCQLAQEKRNKDNSFASYESSQRCLGQVQAKSQELEKTNQDLRLKLHAAIAQKEDLEIKYAKNESILVDYNCIRGEMEQMHSCLGKKNQEIDALKSELQKEKLKVIDLTAKSNEATRLQKQVDDANRKINDMEKYVHELVSSLPSAPTPNSDEDANKSKIKKMLDKYPGRVFIKCIKGEDCPYTDLIKYKYAVPSDYTKSRFETFIRGKLAIDSSTPVVLRILTNRNELVPFVEDMTMGDVFANYQATDGTLSVVYNAR